MNDEIAEQLDTLSDDDLLKALNVTLAKRRTPPTPEQQQQIDDDEFYASLYPPSRHPRSGPMPTRTDDES